MFADFLPKVSQNKISGRVDSAFCVLLVYYLGFADRISAVLYIIIVYAGAVVCGLSVARKAILCLVLCFVFR